MKKLLGVAGVLLLFAGFSAGVDLDQSLSESEKDWVKQEFNSNVGEVPEVLLTPVRNRDVNVYAGEGSYGVRFDGIEVENISNTPFESGDVRVDVSKKAVEQVAGSDDVVGEARDVFETDMVNVSYLSDGSDGSSSPGSTDSQQEEIDTGEADDSDDGNSGVVDKVSDAVDGVVGRVQVAVASFVLGL